MKVINQSVIYENPLPQLRSRQSLFPNLCELEDGTVLACHSISEAFESVNGTSYLSTSYDGGRSFSPPQVMFVRRESDVVLSDTCKITRLGDGRLIAFGYAFNRSNPDLPIGNPQTGGLLEDTLFFSISDNKGVTWSEWNVVNSVWGPHVEASSPVTVLRSGVWVTPVTGFSAWDGSRTGRNCGRILRSEDEGKHWSDDVVNMEFAGDAVTCYEQRLCQIDTGAVVCIGWNENINTGERMNNHYTVSMDDAKTFSKPRCTGIHGQASSVCALHDGKLLATHAVRRDTDRPGIYGYIVDLSHGTWDIKEELLLWEPSRPLAKNTKMAEIFSFLKFGQPSAILLSDGMILMSHWAEEDGQCKTFAARIEL